MVRHARGIKKKTLNSGCTMAFFKIQGAASFPVRIFLIIRARISWKTIPLQQRLGIRLQARADRVPLSFRGKDTSDNFTEQLYSELGRNSARTYRDTEGMKRGDRIKPASAFLSFISSLFSLFFCLVRRYIKTRIVEKQCE